MVSLGNIGVALGRREDEVEKVLFIIPVVGQHAVPGVVMGLEGWGQRGPRLAWSPIPVQQTASADPGCPGGSGSPGAQRWSVPLSVWEKQARQPGPRPKPLTCGETRSTGGKAVPKVQQKSGLTWGPCILGQDSQHGLARLPWALEDPATTSKITRSNRSNAGSAMRFSLWGLMAWSGNSGCLMK